jgi:hypothetical protein
MLFAGSVVKFSLAIIENRRYHTPREHPTENFQQLIKKSMGDQRTIAQDPLPLPSPLLLLYYLFPTNIFKPVPYS